MQKRTSNIEHRISKEEVDPSLCWDDKKGKKEMKKRTSNIEHRISKEEVDPRLRGDDKKERKKMKKSGQTRLRHATTTRQAEKPGTTLGTGQVCENCEYSSGAVGAGEMIFTCERKKPSHRLVVLATEACEKFVRSRELIAPYLAAALSEGAKLIPLTRGKFAIVDAADFELLNRYKWHALKGGQTYYARSQEKGKPIRMHRLITNAPKGLIVDHINHNGTDNRRANLRFCTRAENCRNSLPRRGGTSRYKGVHWCKRRKKFIATITFNRKKRELGYFDSEIDAAKAYDKKARELFGEFAYLNFPQESS